MHADEPSQDLMGSATELVRRAPACVMSSGPAQDNSMPARQYTVKNGEDLFEIAAECGFRSADTIRDHAANAELMADRNEGILRPGDVLTIPEIETDWLALDAGKKNVFRRPGPPRLLKLRLVDDDGDPIANEAVAMSGTGVQAELTTDGAGCVEVEVPVRNCKSLLVTVGDREIELDVADLDPVDSVTGVQARLSNLGYFVGTRDDDYGETTRACVSEFQSDNQLPQTGVACAMTRQKLVDKHGC